MVSPWTARAVQGLTILADDDVLRFDRGNAPEHPDFLISNIFRGERDGSLHGEKSQDLEHMILHDIANDAKFVKVAPTAFRAEGLFEGNLYAVDVVAVPCGTKEFVAESENQQVFDHLLAKVVVDTEDLLLGPVRLQRLLQLS
jgi:hypothetical protein